MIFDFLKDCKGIIHVGANTGNEIPIYKQYPIKCILIEPLPLQFSILSKVAAKAGYKALNNLITNKDNKPYSFIVSNHNGKASSIFLYNDNNIWKNIKQVETIELTSITLTSLLLNEHINISDYDTLVLDTQGSELMVLKGAVGIIKNLKYILTEVADFEMYLHGCQLRDIEYYMNLNGFKEIERTLQKSKKGRSGVRSCWDILYKQLL